MKKLRFSVVCAVATLVLVAFGSLAMSGAGSDSTTRFPKPKKNFQALITDSKDTQTKADLVACDGDTKLSAYRGTARVRIPFSKIERVSFADQDNRYRTATVKFWSGTTHEVSVKKVQMCSGRTELGEMFIKVRDLKSVVFDKGEYAESDDTAPEAKSP